MPDNYDYTQFSLDQPVEKDVDKAEREDMELIPHTEIEAIRDQLLEIKKSPFRDPEIDKQLIKAMNQLDSSLNKIMTVFEEANDHIYTEKTQKEEILEKLNLLFEKTRELEEQNSQIAQGVLALADMFKSPELPPSPDQGPMTENDIPDPIGKEPTQIDQPGLSGADFTNYDDYSKPQAQQQGAQQPVFNQLNIDSLNDSKYPSWMNNQNTANQNSFGQLYPDNPGSSNELGFTPPPPPAQEIEKIPLPPEKRGLMGRFLK